MAAQSKQKTVIDAPPPITRAELVTMFQDRVTTALSEQVANFDTTRLLASIVEDLENKKQQVVLRLLGMDSRWGKYEVDHCNGRKSEISESIANYCKPVIDAWVIAAVEPVLVELKDKVGKEVKAAIKQEVDSIVRYRIRDQANRVAENLLQEMADEVKMEMTDVK